MRQLRSRQFPVRTDYVYFPRVQHRSCPAGQLGNLRPCWTIFFEPTQGSGIQRIPEAALPLDIFNIQRVDSLFDRGLLVLLKD